MASELNPTAKPAAAFKPDRPAGKAAPQDPVAETAPEDQRSLFARFWAPRYWPAWLLIGWLNLTAKLPWRLAIKIHKGLGYLLGLLQQRQRRIVLQNLKVCFPELDEAARRALMRKYFQNVGACLAELAFAWSGSWEKARSLFNVEGLEYIETALQNGNGVILNAGHFTTLEICGPILKSIVPSFALMYRKRSNALIDAVQARGRNRTAHECFANTDIRAMLRSLGNNSVVWYAADRHYAGKNSVLVPFFGVPAMTNPSTSKLARISGAQVIPFSFCRRPDDSGYDLKFSPPLNNFPSGDIEADLRRLVSVLETEVRHCPEQYFWAHRKFKGRPLPYVDIYARD